ncbi:unnamed protein product [Leptosia nina]|uniref:Uncharacterized protein n=1 Tax=Leptosia nina TaxID=320188 RepID=A0AAV1JBF3_9NEOP
MPDREVPAGSGFLPLQFPSAFAAFHATTAQAPPGTMHHATHYHHHAHEKRDRRHGQEAIKGIETLTMLELQQMAALFKGSLMCGCALDWSD